jgi:hypothetical protein
MIQENAPINAIAAKVQITLAWESRPKGADKVFHALDEGPASSILTSSSMTALPLSCAFLISELLACKEGTGAAEVGPDATDAGELSRSGLLSEGCSFLRLV